MRCAAILEIVSRLRQCLARVSFFGATPAYGTVWIVIRAVLVCDHSVVPALKTGALDHTRAASHDDDGDPSQ